MAKRLLDSRYGLETDYERQARKDFAVWDLLERAGMLPEPNQVPTQRLIDKAKRRLGLIPSRRSATKSKRKPRSR